MKRKPNLYVLILFGVLLVILFIWVLDRCGGKPDNAAEDASALPPASGEVTNVRSEIRGYNIRIPENLSAEAFVKQMNANLGIEIKTEHYRTCECDPTLISLNYPGMEIEGHGPAKVRTDTPGGVGRDTTFNLNYGKNYVLMSDSLSHPPIIFSQWASPELLGGGYPFLFKERQWERAPNGNVVAVFDSGLYPHITFGDYGISGIKQFNTDLLCNGIQVKRDYFNHLAGLNFTVDSTGSFINFSDLNDNTKMQHGSKVAHILAEQGVQSADQTPFRILPVKVLGEQNKGDLFSLMCAMSQARKLGSKIFNMSLGYYGPEESLFKSEVEKLAAEGIWLVAAAGNSLSTQDRSSIEAENRDLGLRPDSSKFYPAYFSKDFEHVISVTTVNGSPDQVCDHQNYGEGVVDIGVLANDCAFNVFGKEDPNGGIKGTSYATPVVSGWLAMKPNLQVRSKAELLSGASTSDLLKTKIKNGKFIMPGKRRNLP